jgi:hypothetical protein
VSPDNDAAKFASYASSPRYVHKEELRRSVHRPISEIPLAYIFFPFLSFFSSTAYFTTYTLDKHPPSVAMGLSSDDVGLAKLG